MTQICTFETLFDNVFVVSLPSSSDRRAYISEHLAEAGVQRFTFHDACDCSDPEVETLIASGRVHSYPPCFRCGQVSCGRDDCNNVLIPVQIATFVTYLNLWKKISATPQFSLVVEDDLALNSYWPKVIAGLIEAKRTGVLDLSPSAVRLLRLGWAKNRDHDGDLPFRMSDEVKMSNPCHALTSGYAQALLDRYEKIDTTVDVYTHRDAPLPGEAITVFPPIASELSWSTGAFDSLIHPKTVRAEFLKKQGKVAAAKAAAERVKAHRSHIFHRSFLVTGHPRTGTGFTAKLMGQIGLEIGHESDGKDGVSSWMMAVDDPQNPWAMHPIASSRSWLHWDYLLHPVRDIASAVPSIMRENSHAPASFEFRRRHILQHTGRDLAVPGLSDFERAVVSLTNWSRIIHNSAPHLHFRIEDGVEDLLTFLENQGFPVRARSSNLDTSPVNENKLYQGKRYPKPDITTLDWLSLSEAIWADVVWYCETYGYPLPIQRG